MRTAVTLAVFFGCVPHAAAETVVSAALGGEVHLSPQLTGNGILVAEVNIDDLRVHFNTDTVDVSHRWQAAAETTMRLGVRGQAFVGGLSTNYWERGELRPERGYATSSVGPYLALERRLGDNLFVSAKTTARWWIFGRGNDFEPPRDFTSLEQQLSLTYWGFAPDRSLWEPHHFFRRIRGFGFGVIGEGAFRSHADNWGSDDGRNEPSQRQFVASQWSALGFGSRRVRVQIEQQAFSGWGIDDVARARVGGLNPYTYRLSGVGWPAFLTSRLLAAQASVLISAGPHEFGVSADAVVVRDPPRNGSDSREPLFGTQLIADLRFLTWQVDARLGWALPNDVYLRGPQLQAFAGVGRTF